MAARSVFRQDKETVSQRLIKMAIMSQRLPMKRLLLHVLQVQANNEPMHQIARCLSPGGSRGPGDSRKSYYYLCNQPSRRWCEMHCVTTWRT
jgi:hypothetical protein